jgi:hypothetical protein
LSLDIYRQQDIANVLRATACASEGAAGLALELVEDVSSEKLLEAYRKGQRHALISVGLAFGLEPIGQQVKPGVSPPLAGLLWAESQER